MSSENVGRGNAGASSDGKKESRSIQGAIVEREKEKSSLDKKKNTL